jgi:hypothetical protein
MSLELSNMHVRASRGEKLMRRARSSRAAATFARVGLLHDVDAHRMASSAHLGERRDVDPDQDTALYNCACGLVFEARVRTSIHCPHCGDEQAW